MPVFKYTLKHILYLFIKIPSAYRILTQCHFFFKILLKRHNDEGRAENERAPPLTQSPVGQSGLEWAGTQLFGPSLASRRTRLETIAEITTGAHMGSWCVGQLHHCPFLCWGWNWWLLAHLVVPGGCSDSVPVLVEKPPGRAFCVYQETPLLRQLQPSFSVGGLAWLATT